MNNSTKQFAILLDNGEYDDYTKIVDNCIGIFDENEFTTDKGYFIENIENIKKLDIFDVCTLSIGHVVIRIK